MKLNLYFDVINVIFKKCVFVKFNGLFTAEINKWRITPDKIIQKKKLLHLLNLICAIS